MNLRQQIIQDRAEAIAGQLNVEIDTAFMRLVHLLVTGKGLHDFDLDDVVDGGQDKQLDLISIEEDGESADLYVIQSKNSASFSSNALIQMRNGLRWLFERTRKEVETLPNKALRDKIVEYRALLSNVGPSNIRVTVRFVANGDTKLLSDEFNQEIEGIRSDYDNDTFESFSIEAVGASELIDLAKAQERQSKSVNADLKIKYDANNPSLIKYYSQDLKGLVCSVPAFEIAKLVNDNPDGVIFDLNIRKFLGTRGGVNKDILATCSDINMSYEFWFLNNGITIVCDHFDPVTDPDNPHVKLKNLQIVNGCQTATTLALAQKQGNLAQDVRVLARIYETSDPALVSRIVLTTNNQNQIRSRDLWANDPVQLDMEESFKNYGLFYERKPRQYENNIVDSSKLFTNESVAQWYLAVVLRAPSDARARKYKVWGELHGKVFGGESIEPYIIASLLGRLVSEWLRASKYVIVDDDFLRIIAKRGSFFVGRIVAFLWRGSDDWKQGRQILQAQIKNLQQGDAIDESVLENAFRILADVIRKSEVHSADVDRALKSALLDKDIDKYLYQIGS